MNFADGPTHSGRGRGFLHAHFSNYDVKLLLNVDAESWSWSSSGNKMAAVETTELDSDGFDRSCPSALISTVENSVLNFHF